MEVTYGSISAKGIAFAAGTSAQNNIESDSLDVSDYRWLEFNLIAEALTAATGVVKIMGSPTGEDGTWNDVENAQVTVDAGDSINTIRDTMVTFAFVKAVWTSNGNSTPGTFKGILTLKQ